MRSIPLPVRLTALSVLLVVLAACGSDDADDGASVAFTDPAEGAAVAGGLDVTMTAEGITIEEAGEVRDDAGHFHVIADAGCVEPGTAIDRDADHVHFGGGQSEGTIYLEPGAHDLCLQAGDGVHVGLDATDTISVEVGIDDRDEWCAVAGEVDDLFNSTDESSDEFAVKQVSYENIRRLLAQLEDGLDQVDDSAREAVLTSIDWAASLTDAMIAATDERDTERLLEPVYAAGEDASGAGAPWILDNCGIDIDG